ncbi:E3 ubiquitin-protein ligase RNF14-like isoform X1 [Andrena cerasifolii]|uniref:E3 ubiquitin-protein ligase RNF14-like isoform X1 n=1 Tax=Andrena cerasifolii TaxID=2819439 RepID=UPI004037D5FF
MLQKIESDRVRQEDEILALSSIYNSNYEFSYVQGDIIECHCNIFIKASSLTFKNVYNNDKNLESGLFSKYIVKYLPPVRVYLKLPDDYPSKSPPNFYVTTSWLSPWQISRVCQKLDEVWVDNKGQEILFLWLEFLRNDLLTFLHITDVLDISFLHMVYYNLEDYFKLNLIFESDARAVYNMLYVDPIQFLINYDKAQCETEFRNNYYICIICFEVYCGEKCIKLSNCSHIYCKKCMQDYVAININDGTVNNLTCPSISCDSSIAIHQIKDLCPKLFSKYESLSLRITLSTMKDLIYCPRISCQCPHVKDTDDTLLICAKCDYAFCSYCYKAYHGASPCTVSAYEATKLIQDYQSGNQQQKRLLEKRHGRKQIQIIVEKHLTVEYLNKNAKACPSCQTMTVKISGCNKMTCIHCKAHFCWLCGAHITSSNAYDHFLSMNNTCYRRLLEDTRTNHNMQV